MTKQAKFLAPLCAVSVITLSACGGGISSDPTQSAIVDSDPSSISMTQRSHIPSTGDAGDTVVVSGIRNGGFVAYGFYDVTGDVGTPVSTELLQYSTLVTVSGVNNINSSSGGLSSSLTGDSYGASGTVVLLASPGSNTVTGTGTLDVLGTSDTLDFEMNGVFSGNDLSGTTTVDGRTAETEGQIGILNLIGAFHYSDDTSVMAGGFVNTSAPTPPAP